MILDNIKAAVVIHGPDTKIIQSNKLAQDLLGLSKNQLLGKEAIDPSWHFFDENGVDLPIHRYPVNQVIDTKTDCTNMGAIIYRPDKNDLVDVLINAAPVFDHKGNISRVIVTFLDITDLRQAEKNRAELIEKLQESLEKIKTLSGILPICASCKKIRDDKGYWNQVESYIQKHTKAKFSHGMCPECLDKLYGEEEWYIQAKAKREEKKS